MHRQRRQPSSGSAASTSSSSAVTSASTKTKTTTTTTTPRRHRQTTAATSYRDHLRIADDTPEREHRGHHHYSSRRRDADTPCCSLSLSFVSSASADGSSSTDANNDTTPFIADLHTNASYQHMMDDRQLLDSCTEARLECAAAASAIAGVLAIADAPHQPTGIAAVLPAECPPPSSSLTAVSPLLLERQSSGSGAARQQNAGRLRQWIAYMHAYVEAVAPARAEVLRMGTFERRVRLAEQTDLRRYIASYDRTVKRTVRAAAADDADAEAGDLEGAYLALLLRAIEAQCLLEGYPGMRRSAVAGGRCSIRSADDDADGDGDGDETAAPTTTTVDRRRWSTDYSSAETVASSVFEPDFQAGDSRPCTSLRDELLAMAEAPAPAAASATSAAHKLTKDVVNRWLQLNLQPVNGPTIAAATTTTAARSQPNLCPPASVLSTPDAAVTCSLSSRCISGRVDADDVDSGDSGGSGFTISPCTSEEPIWDGYVDKCRPHRKPVAERATTDSGVNDDADVVRLSAPGSPEHQDDDDGDEDSSSEASSSRCTPLNDSFLLSAAQPPRLTLSTLKRIDDIFAVHHATPHRPQWVAPPAVAAAPTTEKWPHTKRLPPHRSAAGLSEYGDAGDYFLGCGVLETVEPTATTPPPLPRATTMTDKASQTTATAEAASNQRNRRRRRRRPHPKAGTAAKRTENRSTQTDDDQGACVTLLELLENNVGAMRPADIEAIVRLCQAHLECLHRVVLSRTVAGLCGQTVTGTEVGRCELSSLVHAHPPPAGGGPAPLCHCGPIARFVQALVTFVGDYVNAMRQWRLYRAVVLAVARLWASVRAVGVGVGQLPKLALATGWAVAQGAGGRAIRWAV